MAKQLTAFRAKETEWVRLEHSDWSADQVAEEVMRRWRLVRAAGAN
jgi:hypothetical protein